jgi:Fe-Mn family superoxide dismutase
LLANYGQNGSDKAPNFVVNGLKREELIATNSMILHEVYFDSLGGGACVP